MAKKKKVDEEEFVVGEWGAQKHYRCCKCAFDTFEGMAILSHLVSEHDSEVALEALAQLENSKEVGDAKNNFDKNSG